MQADSLDNAKAQARDFIADTDGIAVIVEYGAGNDIAPDMVGEEFVHVINRRDVPGQSFTYYSNDPGIKISYAFDDIVLGPMAFKTAQYNIDNRVIRAKAAGRVARISLGEQKTFDATPDYIKNCKYATCVGIAGSEWSENNPFGVAISVRMGTKSAVTDDQIKMVLSNDFKHYGIGQIKFFFEQNDTPASGMYLHVRGGTEGPFDIGNVRKEVGSVARRAKNKNPATLPIQ
ncbi:MAG: hypothetical protein ACRBBR_06555 [Cellvibrionaceae bacterium]